MMNTSNTKRGTKLLAFAAGFVLFSLTASAQNLINHSTGKVNNEGTIRFRANTADFQNDAAIANITNTGEIHIFGTDQAFTGTNPLTSTSVLRIPGFVSYRATAGSQNINDGYYTDLDVQDAATKVFANGDNYFIGGNYTTAGGNRTYTGSLVTYDGTVAQNVAAENATNGTGYSNLAFENAGLKTLSTGAALATGTTNIAASTATGGFVIDGTTPSSFTGNGDFTQAASAGDLSLISGAIVNIYGTTNSIAANATVTNGTINLGDGTAASATTVTGALNLADAAGNSDLAVNNSATLNVIGTFSNLDLLRTNMTFGATSTVDYQDGAGNIVTTASTNPYGNFIVSKSDAAISPTNNGGTENNINIATSFALNGGQDLDMNGTTGGYVNMMTAATGVVTYGDQEEVIGKFRRTTAAPAAGTYTFNNASTSITFATAPTSGNYFEVLSIPGASNFNYDNTRDVHRNVQLAYDYDGWVSTVQIGYNQSETAGWTAGYTEAQLRYLEGNPSAASTERVATGQAYTRANSTPTAFGTVSLPGFTPTAVAIDGTADAGFLSANELILRAGPGVVASINPGRWSNPATWDTGEQPLAFDSVLVRHNVWAGFVRPGLDNYQVDEAHPTELAAAINIITPTATYPTPTLLVGSSDIVGPFKTSTPGANGTGSIYIGDFGTATPTIPSLADEMPTTDIATNYVGGLLVFGQTAGLDVPEMIVEGNVVIDGAINIGGILSLGQ
jgi:hypothetical protein